MEWKSHLTGVISGYFAPLGQHHLDYIKAAQQECTRLCVIVNNDKQLIQKKGFSFQPEDERVAIMSAIKGVDHVFLSTDQDHTVNKTLFRIRNIWPNEVMVFINSGDVDDNRKVAEYETCRQLGIRLRTGIDGPKTGSSTETLKRHIDFVLSNVGKYYGMIQLRDKWEGE
jgi:glycerol-3-phosphate cytidylyltransferase-like family protein